MSDRDRRERRRKRGESPARRDDGGRASFWATLTFLYWLLLVNLMHQPIAALPEFAQPTPGGDPAAHTLAYALFACLLCRTADALYARGHDGRNAPFPAHALVFLGLAAYGYGDEQTQPWTGRTPEQGDWEADCLGAAFGVCGHILFEIIFGGTGRAPQRKTTQRNESRPKRDAIDIALAQSKLLSKARRRRRRRRHRSDDAP